METNRCSGGLVAEFRAESFLDWVILVILSGLRPLEMKNAESLSMVEERRTGARVESRRRLSIWA